MNIGFSLVLNCVKCGIRVSVVVTTPCLFVCLSFTVGLWCMFRVGLFWSMYTIFIVISIITTKTRAKDILPNIHRTQAAVTVHCRHPPAATEWSGLSLTDVICRIRPTPYNAFSVGMTQQFFPVLSLVTLTFDLWSWHSNSSKRGTKHFFPVNLAQNLFSRSRDIWVTNNKLITDSSRLF